MSERYGVKLKVGCLEIADKLKQRIAHHRRRAAEKEAELPALKKSFESVMGGGKIPFNSSSYRTNPEDIIEKLEGDIKDHLYKAKKFEFIVDHLYDEFYCLDINDVESLEFLK